MLLYATAQSCCVAFRDWLGKESTRHTADCRDPFKHLSFIHHAEQNEQQQNEQEVHFVNQFDYDILEKLQ
jgi:hypothetical protein